jgi:toxin-antitoxin system PIN domain toxin
VSGSLLDVNVLIALVREDHTAHRVVRRWFQRLNGRPWATCAITEAGFVRIISNPRFLERPPELSEALDMLGALTKLPGHAFWTMDVGIADAVENLQDRLFGHQQVTDAYLLGLAIRKKGKLVTLDRAVKNLAGAQFDRFLEVIE